MRITNFRIENFKNIKLAECINPPNFMVICGGNGCGKSALLSALMLAKEAAGTYMQGPRFHSSPISADSGECKISLGLEFDDQEQAFSKTTHNLSLLGATASIEVVLRRDQRQEPISVYCPEAVRRLLSHYSRSIDSPGFFDFINAHRIYHKTQVTSWDPQRNSDEAAKSTLVPIEDHQDLMHGSNRKFQLTKLYLADVVMSDLQALKRSIPSGNPTFSDSLAELRQLFDEFLAPLKFVNVDIEATPFRYIISSPRGEIDIDDLSSGEKEILNIFVRFHQLRPKRSIIFFDEADAHLHPDLQRRYLQALRKHAKDNQIWLTTHSPEMMIAAGSEHLYTLTRDATGPSSNQFVRVTQNDQLHSALSEVMGTRGLVSFNQRIVFIEGEESSADRAIYEKFYPPGTYNVSFVPAGNSATVRKTAERVNELLTASLEFQFFYSIVDGDVDRLEPDPTNGDRLFRLPVYHVENFLLNEEAIFTITQNMLAADCPFRDATEVTKELIKCLLDDTHLKPFTKAMWDAKVSALAKTAYDAVYTKAANSPGFDESPSFIFVEEEARKVLTEAVTKGDWKKQCKGRDLLKTYCRRLNIKYEHFRNTLISNLTTPPSELAPIMDRILGRA